MGENKVHQLVSATFGPTASAYATSPTHSDEKSLNALVALVKPESTDSLLDVATGAGHTGLAFALKVSKVVAYDLTPSMLEVAGVLAKERGFTNFETQQGSAEDMPFADESFDIVTVRTAPHHFSSVTDFFSESYRVLKPGGKFLFVDTTVPEDKQVEEEINHIEKLRDPSHGWNYSASVWRQMIVDAGFKVVHEEVGMHAGGKKMELHQWMDRINTPEENREEIVGSFLNPTPELVEALDIERDGETVWFTLPELTLLAVK